MHPLQPRTDGSATQWDRGSNKLLCVALQLALFSRLCNEVLARRAAGRRDAESLTLAARLLEQNPEVYTAWNYRREALEATFKARALAMLPCMLVNCHSSRLLCRWGPSCPALLTEAGSSNSWPCMHMLEVLGGDGGKPLWCKRGRTGQRRQRRRWGRSCG